MKKIRLFATLAALMGACGGNPPNQSDTSVTPAPDSGTPAPDAGQSDSPTLVDAAVDTDAPVVPADSPVVTNDAPPSECWSQACGRQDIYRMNGTHNDDVSLSCDMMGQRISLSPAGLGCIASCHGDTCSCELDDTDGISVQVRNVRQSDGNCGSTSQLSYTQNGTPMTPSSSDVDRFIKR